MLRPVFARLREAQLDEIAFRRKHGEKSKYKFRARVIEIMDENYEYDITLE